MHISLSPSHRVSSIEMDFLERKWTVKVFLIQVALEESSVFRVSALSF